MDYRPLMYSVVLILIVGVVMPLIISPYVDVDDIPEESAMNPLITLFDEGVSIFGFSINIFGFLGDLQDNLVDYISIFAFIPNIVLIPLVIIMVLGIVYTLIKLIRG